jgi:hypothetical protein
VRDRIKSEDVRDDFETSNVVQYISTEETGGTSSQDDP